MSFCHATAEDFGAGAGAEEYVCICIQQQNGRTSLTNVQGLRNEFSYNNMLKELKKEFCRNGTVVQDPEFAKKVSWLPVFILHC
ncbi:hypothetical protein V6N13_041607 [Hibiscus sabdariffa]